MIIFFPTLNRILQPNHSSGAIGLLAKLVERKGGQVDVALYDTLLSQLNYLASAYLNAGEVPARQPNGGHSFFVPAQIFSSKDGHFALFITHDDFWRTFATAVERPDWLTDARFATMAARSENRAVVTKRSSGEATRRTSAQWVDLLQPLGIVIAAVGALEDALASENVAARHMVVSIATPGGRLRFVGNPIKVEGFEEAYCAPPQLGEHAALLESPRMTADDLRWRRALARELTRRARAPVREAMAAAIAFGGATRRIGVTGPPGAGKSSLIAMLAKQWTAAGDRAGVLAIDPTSPLSGGALLGDRIRMDEAAENPNLFIRSLASGGAHDGLCPNISALLDAFEQAGFDHLILETVGVGRVSCAAKALVDTFVLLVARNFGDTIQAMKAGIMEVADIYVVNKADLPAAPKPPGSCGRSPDGAGRRPDGFRPCPDVDHGGTRRRRALRGDRGPSRRRARREAETGAGSGPARLSPSFAAAAAHRRNPREQQGRSASRVPGR